MTKTILLTAALSLALNGPTAARTSLPASALARQGCARECGEFEHRWGGVVHDVTSHGDWAWTAEDGGRIRYTSNAGANWTFADTPCDAQSQLRRIHMNVDTQGNPTEGWAVGEDGIVLHTMDGGQCWTLLPNVPCVNCGIDDEGTLGSDLFDVFFLDNNADGWLLGLHGLWRTTDGGASWSSVPVTDFGGAPYDLTTIELYALDIVPNASSTLIEGIAVAEPGLVFRALNVAGGVGNQWTLSWDLALNCDPNWYDTCLSFGDCSGMTVAPCDPAFLALHHFEPWDVELVQVQPDPSPSYLAIMVGGTGNGCGLILASNDPTYSVWVEEEHACENAGPGQCPPQTSPQLASPHSNFRTLYGLGVFDEDRSAIACGYNGQHVRREASDLPGAVWHDESQFSVPWHYAGSNPVFNPSFLQNGADADEGNQSTGKAWIVGDGGHIRRTEDGGEVWIPQGQGGPYRDKGIYAMPPNGGQQSEIWACGIHGRIAKSCDGGLSWTNVTIEPTPQSASETFEDITFADNGLWGVAVGGVGSAPSNKIRYTDNAGTHHSDWPSAGSITFIGAPNTNVLVEVDWAAPGGGLVGEFWAVGNGGLILHSPTGEHWNELDGAPDFDFSSYNWRSVDFVVATAGFLVGQDTTTNTAVAFLYRPLAQPPLKKWTDVTGQLASMGVIDLTSVGVWGTAYAVGTRLVSGDREGVLVRYDNGGSNLFEVVVPPMAPSPFFPRRRKCLGTLCGPCLPGQLAEIQVLDAIAVFPDPANDQIRHVWMAGDDGQVWRYIEDVSGPPVTWDKFKSQTDYHIEDLSFTLAQDGRTVVGYALATGDQTTLVRYNPSGGTYPECPPPDDPTTPICFGDGTLIKRSDGSPLNCPCGNNSPVGDDAGCLNSTFMTGGTLRAPMSGTSVSANDFVLEATHAPGLLGQSGNGGLLLVNTGLLNPPLQTFDGILCVGGGVRVLAGQDDGVSPDSVAGDGVRTMHNVISITNGLFPGTFEAGSTYVLQYFYRDVLCGPPPAFCVTPCTTSPRAAANFTNACTVTLTL